MMAMTHSYSGLILVSLVLALTSSVDGLQSVVYKKVNITMVRPPVLLTDSKHSAGHFDRPLGPVLTKNDIEGHIPHGSYFRIAKKQECTLKCRYGREVDIEGRSICKCKLAPCKRIECPQGMKCLVKKFCEYGVCDDKPYCEVEDTCKLSKPSNFYFGCEKLTKRYYFDTKKGKCRRFWGCKEIEGNNFSNKKECKRTCYKHRRTNKKSDIVKRIEASRKSLSNQIVESNIIRPEPALPRRASYSRGGRRRYSDRRSSVRGASAPASRSNPQRCPADKPYEKCPYDPCSKCNNSEYICFKSFCGRCQAIFINLQTGHSVKSADTVCGPDAKDDNAISNSLL